MEFFNWNNDFNEYFNKYKYFNVNFVNFDKLNFNLINEFKYVINIKLNVNNLMNIKNIDTHDIEIPYEGITYILPKDKVVAVPKELIQFIEERFPLSFSYGAQIQKEKAPEVETYKTKIYTAQSIYNQTQDMHITPVKPVPTFGADDMPLSGTSDSDGIEYYGEGIEVDTPN